MAQPFKVDIFSEDSDVKDPIVKRDLPPVPHPTEFKPIPVQCRRATPNFIPIPVNYKKDKYKQVLVNYKQAPANNNHVLVNNKLLQAVKQKQLNNKQVKAVKQKLQNTNITTKTKKKKKKIKKALQPPKIDLSKPQPIPTVQRCDVVKAVKIVNIEMDRPNLKVVEGTAGSIKLNQDKSKGVTVQENLAVKPEKIPDKPKPADPPKVSPAAAATAPAEQSKPQTSGVKGRIPASAFMNIDHQIKSKPNNWSAVMETGFNPHLSYTTYPKGIPKSFLLKEHIEQLQSSPRPPASNPPTKGPVWEAKIPTSTAPAATPAWPPASCFDQLASGQYIPMSSQDSPFPQEPMYSGSGQPMFAQADANTDEITAQYSPSDTYADIAIPEPDELSLDSADLQSAGSKRLSAFQRLGPVTQPKKPKLTINLLVGKEQAVREVVDESGTSTNDDKYLPVTERPDIQTSLDDTVMKYLTFWPWKKPISVRRTLCARESKNVMQTELDLMLEHYEKDKMFFKIEVRGYPESWNMNDVLDTLLEALKGKSFIPCFIDFGRHVCKFLVIRSKPALVAIHKMNFTCQRDEVVLHVSILHVNLSVNQIDFIPRLILRKRLSMSMEGETELHLKHFTLAPDLSHFLYFPLHRVSNQTELLQLQSSVPWQALTKLVLSHNNITTLSGFELPAHTPHLKHLDVSFNRIESISQLVPLRALPLTALLVEGNPLCSDYIDPDRYTRLLKMMFSSLREIDGVKLVARGEFPPHRRNYCPPCVGGEGAQGVAARLLETLFPLLDAGVEERARVEHLYSDDAVMTLTFMYKLRYGAIYKDHRTLFSRARIMDEGEMDAIEGAATIAKIIHRWPKLQHDPLTFCVDVMYHTDTTTMLRVSGIMKVSPETLAEDEHLLHFTRTLVLHSPHSTEYKITNEMLYWDLPDRELARGAFALTTVRNRNLNLKLDGPPDVELREKLLEIFMTLTDLDRKPSERCLESKDWHLRNALEYFTKLLKQDNLDPILR